MRLRFADSATKHGITHDQSRHVIEHAGRRWIQPSPAGGVPGDRLVYLGDDQAGNALEIMAVELEGGWLLVIHALPMRSKYRPQYRQAMREARR